MIEKIHIHEAKFEDASKVTMLKLQVWLHTYATDGIEREYADYLVAEITQKKTEHIIQNPDKKIFLLEKREEQLVVTNWILIPYVRIQKLMHPNYPFCTFHNIFKERDWANLCLNMPKRKP